MDRLMETWRAFLRLSPGERREFVNLLREAKASEMAARRASRGTNAGYRRVTSFDGMTLDGADLEPPSPPAKPSPSEDDFASLDFAE